MSARKMYLIDRPLFHVACWPSRLGTLLGMLMATILTHVGPPIRYFTVFRIYKYDQLKIWTFL